MAVDVDRSDGRAHSRARRRRAAGPPPASSRRRRLRCCRKRPRGERRPPPPCGWHRGGCGSDGTGPPRLMLTIRTPRESSNVRAVATERSSKKGVPAMLALTTITCVAPAEAGHAEAVVDVGRDQRGHAGAVAVLVVAFRRRTCETVRAADASRCCRSCLSSPGTSSTPVSITPTTIPELPFEWSSARSTCEAANDHS